MPAILLESIRISGTRAELMHHAIVVVVKRLQNISQCNIVIALHGATLSIFQKGLHQVEATSISKVKTHSGLIAKTQRMMNSTRSALRFKLQGTSLAIEKPPGQKKEVPKPPEATRKISSWGSEWLAWHHRKGCVMNKAVWACTLAFCVYTYAYAKVFENSV